MTLPSSGPIKISEYNTELELSSSTVSQDLNSSLVRYLLQDTTDRAPISMSYGYGKSYTYSFNLTSGTNLDLRTQAIASGWNGVRPVAVYIPSGVIIGSTSTSSYALTIQGSFPNGVTLINNGYIVGMGGSGGSTPYGGYGYSQNGTSGGPALQVLTSVTITNNGTIGGGGGGGSAAIVGDHLYWGLANGEGGGGAGSSNGSGGISYYGANNGDIRWYQGSGYYVIGGINGQNATTTSGGLGSTGGVNGGQSTIGFLNGQGSTSGFQYCYGGNGGALGSAGATGYSSTGDAVGSSGSGGAAVVGNSYVTWITTGTIFGSQS